MKCNIFLLLYLPFTTAYGQSPPQPVTVPFELVGNTIFVEAVVNGEPGNFIIDTGAPKTFLNSAYFDGIAIPWQGDAVMDVNGHASGVSHYVMKELTLSGYQLSNGYALVTDLKSLEESKDIPITGILGYPVFRDLEILFDFDKKQLLLFTLDRKGRRLCSTPDYTPVDSLEMKMSGHFPCIIAQFGDRKLRLGIDSGAEVNILHQRIFRKKQPHLEAESSVILKGMKNERKICRSGKISGLNVGHLETEDTEVIIADLESLNEHLDFALDGMLGAPFLMRGTMAINYRQKKLYLWEDVENTLAEKTQIAVKEVVASGLK